MLYMIFHDMFFFRSESESSSKSIELRFEPDLNAHITGHAGSSSKSVSYRFPQNIHSIFQGL